MPTKDRYQTQIQEVVNRNSVVTLALNEGYNVFLPVFDGGVDFILYRERDGELRKVQLKGRWTIDKKYERRDIWIAFKYQEQWYMMPHDEMVRLSPDALKTKAWNEIETYHRPHLSKEWLDYALPIASRRAIASCTRSQAR